MLKANLRKPIIIICSILMVFQSILMIWMGSNREDVHILYFVIPTAGLLIGTLALTKLVIIYQVKKILEEEYELEED